MSVCFFVVLYVGEGVAIFENSDLKTRNSELLGEYIYWEAIPNKVAPPTGYTE